MVGIRSLYCYCLWQHRKPSPTLIANELCHKLNNCSLLYISVINISVINIKCTDMLRPPYTIVGTGKWVSFPGLWWNSTHWLRLDPKFNKILNNLRFGWIQNSGCFGLGKLSPCLPCMCIAPVALGHSPFNLPWLLDSRKRNKELTEKMLYFSCTVDNDNDHYDFWIGTWYGCLWVLEGYSAEKWAII